MAARGSPLTGRTVPGALSLLCGMVSRPYILDLSLIGTDKGVPRFTSSNSAHMIYMTELASPMRRLVRLLLLLLLVDRGTPLQQLACAMPRPMPLRLEHKHRELPAVTMAAGDEDDYDGSEESKPEEDLDLSWNRYSLE